MIGLFITLLSCVSHVDQVEASELDSWNVETDVFSDEKQLENDLDLSQKINSRFARASYSYNSGTIKIIKYDSCTGALLGGAQFTIYNQYNSVVQVVQTNSGTGSVSVSLPVGNYTIKETAAPEGYQLESSPITVSVYYGGQSICLSKYNNPLTGSIKVVKKNESNQVLAGAVFTVYNQSNQVVGTITTNSNGEAQLDNLSYGTYKLVEIQAPDGYILDATPKTVTISSTAKIVTLDIINKKGDGSLIVTKKNQNDQVLAGAVFKVCDQSNQVVGTITTDSNGEARLDNLSYGTYTITETTAPSGYDLDTTVKTVTISETNKVATLTVINTKSTGSLKVLKTNENNEPLSNAMILVMTSNSAYVASGLTNAEGLFIVDNLAFGDYKVFELSAPEGYETENVWHNISIDKNSPNGEATLTLVNKKIPTNGNLEILKTDSTENKLQGATFEVKNSSGVVVATVTTDAQGRALVNDLPFGNYTVKEIEAPEGYLIDTTEKNITISSTGTVSVTFTDTKKPTTGSIKIIKYVTGSNPEEYLEDITFTLYDKDRNKIQDYITDANGEILIENLALGQYYVAETIGKPGYQEDTSLYSVVVSEAGEIYTMRHGNELIQSRGKLKVTKYAKDDKGVETTNRLGGAVFTVTDKDGNIQQKTTDANGEVLFEGLQEGQVTVKEITPPTKYQADQEVYKINIVKDTTAELITYNMPIVEILLGRLFVYVSSADNLVEGLTYEIINTTNTSETSRTATTNKFGQISLMLPEGNYIILPVDKQEPGFSSIESFATTNQSFAEFDIFSNRFTVVNLTK